ncbi:MAG: hypothetical protein GF353_06100 [Candidatus Lokiarchaeota archaeon]|nr:hypothetical protein [Candidatus Lokiarchaeota archaeon]
MLFFKINLCLLASDCCGTDIAPEYCGGLRSFLSDKYGKKGFVLTESNIARYLEEVKKRMKIEKPMQIKKTQLKRSRLY